MPRPGRRLRRTVKWLLVGVLVAQLMIIGAVPVAALLFWLAVSEAKE